MLHLVTLPSLLPSLRATSAVDDKDTEWRTTRQFVDLGIRQRGEKNFLYCERTYKGGPDMIRAHLLSEVKPRSVGPACQPKANYQQLEPPSAIRPAGHRGIKRGMPHGNRDDGGMGGGVTSTFKGRLSALGIPSVMC